MLILYSALQQLKVTLQDEIDIADGWMDGHIYIKQ